MRIENRIKEMRLRQGMSQRKLAEAIGTSQQQIDLLEKSERKVSIEWMDKLSKGLNVSPLDLLPKQWDRGPSVDIDKGLLKDILIAIDDILQKGTLSAEEKAKLITILYEEYQDLPHENRKEKIIEFSRLYLKTKSA